MYENTREFIHCFLVFGYPGETQAQVVYMASQMNLVVHILRITQGKNNHFRLKNGYFSREGKFVSVKPTKLENFCRKFSRVEMGLKKQNVKLPCPALGGSPCTPLPVNCTANSADCRFVLGERFSGCNITGRLTGCVGTLPPVVTTLTGPDDGERMSLRCSCE